MMSLFSLCRQAPSEQSALVFYCLLPFFYDKLARFSVLKRRE